MPPIVIEHYTMEFTTSHPMRKCHLGKHAPITTQCVIKHNNCILGVGTVVKHAKDEDNKKYARASSAKKALAQTSFPKQLRKMFWDKILKMK